MSRCPRYKENKNKMKNVNACEVKKIRYKKRNVRIISFLKKRSFTSFKENRKRVIKMAELEARLLGGGGNAKSVFGVGRNFSW